jgi:hypothetical protein
MHLQLEAVLTQVLLYFHASTVTHMMRLFANVKVSSRCACKDEILARCEVVATTLVTSENARQDKRTDLCQCDSKLRFIISAYCLKFSSLNPAVLEGRDEITRSWLNQMCPLPRTSLLRI